MSESPQSSKKLNGFIQQAANSRMWLFAFLVQTGVLVFFFKLHFSHDEDNRQILVPYSMATLERKVEYAADIDSAEDYVALIAMADVNLWGSWKPKSIKGQYRRFLKRTSPELYRVLKPELDKAAAVNSENAVVQNIRITENVTIRSNDKAFIVPVVIEKSILGKDQPVEMGEVIIKYKTVNGLPTIQTFEFEPRKRAR